MSNRELKNRWAKYAHSTHRKGAGGGCGWFVVLLGCFKFSRKNDFRKDHKKMKCLMKKSEVPNQVGSVSIYSFLGNQASCLYNPYHRNMIFLSIWHFQVDNRKKKRRAADATAQTTTHKVPSTPGLDKRLLHHHRMGTPPLPNAKRACAMAL